MKNEAQVFGVPVEGLSLAETLERLEAPRDRGAFWIVTANAEILLAARRDAEYAETLKQADLRLVDGSGPQYLLNLFGYRVRRVAGVDLAEALIGLAARRSWKVGLIGAASSGALEDLKRRHPALTVVAEEGGRINRDGTGDTAADEALHRLMIAAPDVLFVGFGHPKQERWIRQNREAFPNAKAIVGVGGTFDLWAGKISRAPKWMRVVGLEWMWRLLMEPKRIRRIWDAVVVFPFAFLFDRLKSTTPRGA